MRLSWQRNSRAPKKGTFWKRCSDVLESFIGPLKPICRLETYFLTEIRVLLHIYEKIIRFYHPNYHMSSWPNSVVHVTLVGCPRFESCSGPFSFFFSELDIIKKNYTNNTRIETHQSLTWVSTANNIMAKLTNDSNNQTYTYHLLTIHNLHDSEDDFCSGCRNVSHCQQQQFFSELH